MKNENLKIGKIPSLGKVDKDTGYQRVGKISRPAGMGIEHMANIVKARMPRGK